MPQFVETYVDPYGGRAEWEGCISLDISKKFIHGANRFYCHRQQGAQFEIWRSCVQRTWTHQSFALGERFWGWRFQKAWLHCFRNCVLCNWRFAQRNFCLNRDHWQPQRHPCWNQCKQDIVCSLNVVGRFFCRSLLVLPLIALLVC